MVSDRITKIDRFGNVHHTYNETIPSNNTISQLISNVPHGNAVIFKNLSQNTVDRFNNKFKSDGIDVIKFVGKVDSVGFRCVRHKE